MKTLILPLLFPQTISAQIYVEPSATPDQLQQITDEYLTDENSNIDENKLTEPKATGDIFNNVKITNNYFELQSEKSQITDVHPSVLNETESRRLGWFYSECGSYFCRGYPWPCYLIRVASYLLLFLN